MEMPQQESGTSSQNGMLENIVRSFLIWVGLAVVLGVFIYATTLKNLLWGTFLLGFSGFLCMVIPMGMGAFFYRAARTRGFQIIGMTIGLVVALLIIWYLIVPAIVENLVKAIEGLVSVLG